MGAQGASLVCCNLPDQVCCNRRICSLRATAGPTLACLLQQTQAGHGTPHAAVAVAIFSFCCCTGFPFALLPLLSHPAPPLQSPRIQQIWALLLAFLWAGEPLGCDLLSHSQCNCRSCCIEPHTAISQQAWKPLCSFRPKNGSYLLHPPPLSPPLPPRHHPRSRGRMKAATGPLP